MNLRLLVTVGLIMLMSVYGSLRLIPLLTGPASEASAATQTPPEAPETRSEGDLASHSSEHTRAVGISVAATALAASMLGAGDHIDVLLHTTPAHCEESLCPDASVRTVASDLAVLAIGPEEGAGGQAGTWPLMVAATEPEARRLLLANGLGELSVVLRTGWSPGELSFPGGDEPLRADTLLPPGNPPGQATVTDEPVVLYRGTTRTVEHGSH